MLTVLQRDFVQRIRDTSQCVKHGAVKLTERPIDCPICAHDLREFAKQALETNAWLDQWRKDMLVALEEP